MIKGDTAMLEIKPIKCKEEQIEVLTLCHIEYKENCFAYKAFNDGSLLAAAQFDINGETAELDAMRQAEGTKEDFEGMFILGRAVLNFLDLCGVETVVSHVSDEAERRLLKCIGFKEENGLLTVSLAGMFDAHCDGHGGCSS